ncbi:MULTISPECIES: hypothetical protein [Sorangium]|uniref:Uncharacterized protein n=1 Tax=Sorangium cellulosum TaxID=56 RepID=A0A4P2QT70_SORCE|nr:MULTISPECIES: hypothetical protein [Sorangium]AUX33470.1 hypothetical protein SOCE836_056300 [Sorangium cellulosum]WCQ92786.1 Virginiamycin B lyase [Sorangium sp. Soce836]
MRGSKRSAATLALAALAPGLHGCAEIAGIEDRQVIPLIVIAEDQGEPRGIALDEEAIYWTSATADGSRGGALRRQIKDEREVIDLLAPSSEVPDVIALDATHIYWSSTDAAFTGDCDSTKHQRDKLRKLPKAATFPAALDEPLWGSCGAAEAIALSADNVYSARPNGSRITWIPKAGGTRKDLFVGDEPAGVATDGALVYWTDRADNTLSVDNTSDADDAEQLRSDLVEPGLLVLDEANLYWLTQDGVMRYPRITSEGDAPSPLLKGLSGPPTGIAAHGDYLYVTVRTAGDVYRIRKDGTAEPEIIAPGQGGPTGIAVDGSGVYWTNTDAGQIVRFNDE